MSDTIISILMMGNFKSKHLIKVAFILKKYNVIKFFHFFFNKNNIKDIKNTNIAIYLF